MSIQKKKIFVVDDDTLLSSMLSDYLQQNPMYSVSIYNTGEDCVKNLYQNPDVVILDYELSSVSSKAGDGLQILQQIKKMDWNIEVIMLSSQTHYSKALQTIAKGAMHYVIKGEDSFSTIGEILQEIFAN